MATKRDLLLISFLLCALFLITPQKIFSADLPKSMQEILKKGKMDPSILSGIDTELKVPKKFIEGAKKEGKLRILSTLDPRQAKAIFKPFNERYPYVSIEYSRASGPIRRIKTLTALKQGRLVTDILTGVGGSYFLFREANGLEDLRDIPNWKNNPEGTKDPDGFWVGMHLRYWCMGYNTELVKKEDLPKKWEDLVTNPRWRNKNLALGNRAQLWALMLWKAKGEEWTKNFLTKLFTEVKPQLRKEGMNAML
ncbi:MAG: extracellular solute-binding protein, partial [Deltaproteobacteria bacterium]|nr:extracellular solute-binding protein [Deltaproteobacteria bacterium]